mmetsp:Transcript_120707/g.341986  ORF Transcript_120707/g.341986 Transcript_120707/m.341986 type:complete len:316 (+) Transcript_120707:87-1034(+)
MAGEMRVHAGEEGPGAMKVYNATGLDLCRWSVFVLANELLAAVALMQVCSRLFCTASGAASWPPVALSLVVKYVFAMLAGFMWRLLWKLLYPRIYGYHGTSIGMFNRTGFQVPFWRSISIRTNDEIRESEQGMLGPGTYLTTSVTKAREVGGWDVFVAPFSPVNWLPQFNEPLPLWNFGLSFCNPAPGGAFIFSRAPFCERPHIDRNGVWRYTGKGCVFFASDDWEKDEFCVQGNVSLMDPWLGTKGCSENNLTHFTRVAYRCLALAHPFDLQFLSPDLFSYRTLLFWLLMFKVLQYDMHLDLMTTCQFPYFSPS